MKKTKPDKRVSIIQEAGIVGAGGAGFPAYFKLLNKVDYVIANGAECEPLIQVDQQLLSEFTEKILTGLDIIKEVTNAKKAIICVKKKYKSALKALNKHIKKFKDFEIKILNDFYPSGDERVLVYEATKRIVPQGGIPLNVGCVVNNVHTLYHIAEAVEEKRPVTHRWVTITGNVRIPMTLNVPIGTEISDLIDLCGGINTKEKTILLIGGPMMGRLTDDFKTPISKTSGSVCVLPRCHFLVQKKMASIEKNFFRARASCMQCRICTDLCPLNILGYNLNPHLIMRSLFSDLEKTSESEFASQAFLCVECSVCSLFSCPHDLKPGQIYGGLKKILAKKNIKFNDNNKNLKIHSLRDFRVVPVKRLVSRLKLQEFVNIKAPLTTKEINIKKVRIPIKQNIGVEPEVIVKEKDNIKAGQEIAIAEKDSLSVNLHSSINGIIKKITKEFIEIHKN